MNELFHVNAPITADFKMDFYFSDEERVEQAKLYPPHIHDTLEFYILVEGDASFLVEHNLYRLSHGDVIISKPNEVHNCILNSDSYHRHFCFWFSPDCDFLFSDFLAHDFGEGNKCSPTPEDAERLITVCTELYKASKYGKDLKQSFFLAMEMLNLIRRNLAPEAVWDPMPPVLRDILEDIHLHLCDIHSLDHFSEHYFISQSTLNRLFRKYLRVSPKVYLETKRLALSRILLKSGRSVTEACAEAGFPDYSNYIRLFRRSFGMTPLQYRNTQA